MRRSATLPLVLLAAFACFGGGAVAQVARDDTQPEALKRIYACADVSDPQARLACFDTAVGALKTAQAQGQFAAVDATGVRKIEREAFGFVMPSLPKLGLPGFSRRESDGASVAIEPTNQVEFSIDRIGFMDGHETFVMSNGQIWAHIDSETNRFARAGSKVNIRRAALGSYLMHVESGGPALRVRRVE